MGGVMGLAYAILRQGYVLASERSFPRHGGVRMTNIFNFITPSFLPLI